MNRWPRLRSAVLAGGMGLAGALVVASLLGLSLGPWSVDQPLEGREVWDWGWRWGGVMAVALASGAALGPSAPAGGRACGRVVALTGLMVLGTCLLAAFLAALAVRLHIWGQTWGLPSRAGYGAKVAGLGTAEIMGLPAAALAGWGLARLRRRMPHG